MRLNVSPSLPGIERKELLVVLSEVLWHGATGAAIGKSYKDDLAYFLFTTGFFFDIL